MKNIKNSILLASIVLSLAPFVLYTVCAVTVLGVLGYKK